LGSYFPYCIYLDYIKCMFYINLSWVLLRQYVITEYCSRIRGAYGRVRRYCSGSVRFVYGSGSSDPPYPDRTVPWCLVPRPLVHPFNFFSVSAFLSTRRGPCRSEAPSTARAAPGDHKPLIGGARWRSMGELRLGRIVTRTKGRGTKRQGTRSYPSPSEC
jgi:hypothetical protein